MIGAEQSCGRTAINGIPIVGAMHRFTAGLKIRRANTLNRCARTLGALCVERVFVSIRKWLFSMRLSLFNLEPHPSDDGGGGTRGSRGDSCVGNSLVYRFYSNVQGRSRVVGQLHCGGP